jgi:nucleotide-binding universal stress UspA family protein
MKILATFDGSAFSEAILPLLSQVAGLPEAEIVLFRVGDQPGGRRDAEAVSPMRVAGFAGQGGQAAVVPEPEPHVVENKEQAVERRLAELRDYLSAIAKRLPPGTPTSVAADIDHDPARAIIRKAKQEQPAVIVMATHGRTGLAHALLGSIAERVVRSGVAPVLLVHPEDVKKRQQQDE